VLLQTMFNTGAALLVARMGGAVADVSELIPFFLRISRYFCGVMYLIITLPAALTNWEKQVLSLNPFAVYIQLVRVAFMGTYRTNSAGNAPFNNYKCQTFLHHQGTDIPGTNIPNYAWQASCHAIVTNNDLWIAAVGWGIAFFVVGIVFFWQAESKYGRG
jgi:teichoic acid transport system permease protein